MVTDLSIPQQGHEVQEIRHAMEAVATSVNRLRDNAEPALGHQRKVVINALAEPHCRKAAQGNRELTKRNGSIGTSKKCSQPML